MGTCKNCGKKGIKNTNQYCQICEREGFGINPTPKPTTDFLEPDKPIELKPIEESTNTPNYSLEPITVNIKEDATSPTPTAKSLPKELILPLYSLVNGVCRKYKVDELSKEEVDMHSEALIKVLDKYVPAALEKNSEVAALVFATAAIAIPRVMQHMENTRIKQTEYKQSLQSQEQPVEQQVQQGFPALNNAMR
jgi:hypothetical protein